MATKKKIIIGVIVCAIIVGIVLSMVLGGKDFDGPYTEYKCDVKNFHLNTTIEIAKEGEDFAKIKGKIKLLTDPLTMYDLDGNKISYAGDAYHFIAQDSHAIYVNGEFSVEMVGLVDWFGESYEIYDNEQNLIGTAEFNTFNTEGYLYDEKGNIIADYTSKLLFNDFTLRISEDCNLDENTILMLFCSYYSDQYADS